MSARAKRWRREGRMCWVTAVMFLVLGSTSEGWGMWAAYGSGFAFLWFGADAFDEQERDRRDCGVASHNLTWLALILASLGATGSVLLAGSK